MDIRQTGDAFARHFDLRHNPFAPASNFQFYKPRRRAVLEQLIHFSRYSQLVLAVTGPRGSGKTVLRHAMAAASKETAINVPLSAFKHSDAAGIIQQLASALGMLNADVMGLLEGVELAGKDVQLLIDDAEALDASALLLLQRLAEGNGKARCKVFLFGEPALQVLLQGVSQQSDGLEYHLIELESWDDDEVEGYLQQRLQGAGRDLDLFTDQELSLLLERGQGWPGILNQQAQELLLARLEGDTAEHTGRERSTVRGKSPLPYRHLAALLVVAFLFILVWYQLDGGAEQPQEAQPVRLPEPEPAVVVKAGEEPVQTGVQAQRRIMLDLPATAETAADVPAAVQIPASPVRSVVVDPVVSAPEPEVVEPPPVVLPKPEPVMPDKQTQPAAPVASKPVQPPKPKVTAAVEARQAARTDNWYANQAGQHYTLQLFATASEQNARQFVQKNGNQFHYFRKTHQGQPLFVVTHGRFDNSAAAKAAVARLPESIQRNQPWPRTFSSIRQEMR